PNDAPRGCLEPPVEAVPTARRHPDRSAEPPRDRIRYLSRLPPRLSRRGARQALRKFDGLSRKPLRRRSAIALGRREPPREHARPPRERDRRSARRGIAAHGAARRPER